MYNSPGKMVTECLQQKQIIPHLCPQIFYDVLGKPGMYLIDSDIGKALRNSQKGDSEP